MIRTRGLSCLLVATAGAAALGGCGVRDRPYRFASPMLGTATIPLEPLPEGAPPRPTLANREPQGVRAEPIRVVSAPRVREASAAGAAAITTSTPTAREEVRSQLSAPHRQSDAVVLTARIPSDLRTLVGRRDPRDPVAAAVGWARDLGIVTEGATGEELVAWAERAERLRTATTPPDRGDLIVFDRAVGDGASDLVGVVIARDERSVTEFLFLGGGIVRRGFVDATRPTVRRDATGAVVNTFLRTGKRWPPKGTRYLAGELLAHVIDATP